MSSEGRLAEAPVFSRARLIAIATLVTFALIMLITTAFRGGMFLAANDALRDNRVGFVNVLFRSITLLGDPLFFVLIISVIFWIRDPRLAIRLLHYLIIGQYVNSFLKLLVREPRPYAQTPHENWEASEEQITEWRDEYGMPSGHTQAGATFWGALYLRTKNPVWRALVVLTIVMVGVSRVYLGVHWVGDVAVGLALALIVLLVGEPVYDRIARRCSRLSDGQKLGIIIGVPVVLVMIPILIFGPDRSLGTITGSYIGAMVGYTFQPRIAPMKRPSSWIQGLSRVVLGLVIVATFLYGLGYLFDALAGDEINWVTFILRIIRYGAVAGSAIILAPLLFHKLGLVDRGGVEEE